ncbi:hypothetical protein KA107_00870 [Candidatus Pacearchaeota archaeon]|nr:hypothetical protein [Candidatus Pacearchaeota archaeon]
MALNKLLTEREARVTTGYISSFVQFTDGKPVVQITHDDSGRGPTSTGLNVSLEELGLRSTNRFYLRWKRHPVVMYTEGRLGIAREIYDGITGKALNVQ